MKKTENSNENNDQSLAVNKDHNEQSSVNTDTAKKTNARNHTLALSFSTFSVIVAVLAIIIFAYAMSHLQKLKTQVNRLDATLGKNQQQISLQDTYLTDIKQKIGAIISNQDQQKNQLEQNSQQLINLRQIVPNVKEDLGLNDIEQLISIANIKLYWQKDIASSIQLLEIADQQIANLDDPSLLPIRQEIAKKRNELQVIPKVDIDGILSELNAIGEQIPKLAQIKNQLPPTQQTTPPSTAQTDHLPQSAWQDMLADSWEQLQKVIIVRHHDLATQPLLPPEQSAYLIENIQLSLMKSQWAILQSNQALYNSSLKQAAEWIGTYLNDNHHAENIMNTLKQLQTETLNPAVPNLNHLLALVQSSIQTRNTTPNQEETPET